MCLELIPVLFIDNNKSMRQLPWTWQRVVIEEEEEVVVVVILTGS